MTKLLGQNGASDFIWRVDWRLRPNASATTLAMSTTAAHEYYYYSASPWHRLALIKARVVAGDLDAGNAFLESLSAFLWRQNLDYRALDELAEIKQRINLEHPGLRVERKWREPIGSEIAGFNLKLGTGGIREVEFIANALQLIWGGKQYRLRTSNTISALENLGELGHLQRDVAKQLTLAYCDLRKIENGVQMLGNQQTHVLPADSLMQQKLLTLLDYDDWQSLTEQVNRHRRAVNAQFEVMFLQQEPHEHETFTWPDGLTAAAQEIVQDWEAGFLQYGVASRKRHHLLPLARALSKHLARIPGMDSNRADASITIVRLHEFFRSLPRGEQYFRLLSRSPALLDNIVMPLLHSPPMSKLLKQSPHIIDCYMQEPWRYPEQGFDANYVMHAERYDVQLERLRRFVNEHLYQLYLFFLQGEMSVEDLQVALSDLAEYTLEITLEIVTLNMQLEQVPIAVLGMGKAGLRRMSPTSDLDLVFVFDAGETSLDMASRFVSRLQTAISSPMREGIVYELDTRLRPSGRSGAATVSVDSFAAHQRLRAHTWEHIALVPSRPVAGNKNLFAEMDKVKMDVLCGRREAVQFHKDALKMWQRIAEHRVEQTPAEIMFSKLRPGGLMQSEYLAACYILAADRPFSSADFEQILAESLQSTDITNLGEIIQFWRIQQVWERLLGKTGEAVETIPAPYLDLLLQHSGVSNAAGLYDKKRGYAEAVEGAMNRFFAEISKSGFDPEEWVESNVNWL
ncbi:MAG: hypothetical protein KJP04_03760 [Arenicella sp.]|nr:hypothetical protein [Arenicella sp.]